MDPRPRRLDPGPLRARQLLQRALLQQLLRRVSRRPDRPGPGNLRGVPVQRAAGRAGVVAAGDGCDPVTNGIPCEECQQYPAVLEIEGSRYLCLACITPPPAEN